MKDGNDKYQLENWVDERGDRELPTSDYWDNPSNEEGKAFNVIEGGFEALENSSKLRVLFEQAKDLLKLGEVNLNGRILSLAAGTCWLESWLLKGAAFEHLTAVDFSEHRIHRIAPKTLDHYGITTGRVTLAYGDILDLKVEAKSQDVVLLCQAFHHASEPRRLLDEVKRVLKDDGKVIILGEHYYSASVRMKAIWRHFRRWIRNRKNYRRIHSFLPEYQMLFPPSFEKGDIHYSLYSYDVMFRFASLDYLHQVSPCKTLQGFVLWKN